MKRTSFLRSARLAVAVLLLASLAMLGWWARRGAGELPSRLANTSAAHIVRDDKLLSLAERQRLWDIEHIAFLVEQKGFPGIKRALVQGNRQGLAAYLADEFCARLPDDQGTSEFHDAGMEVRRVTRTEGREPCAGANDFLDAFLAYRRLFDAGEKSCTASIGLVRHSPIEPANLAGAWRGVWKITLAGTRGESRIEVTIRMGVELGPLGEDIEQRRGWIHAAEIDRVEVAQSAGPLMRDVTRESGIDVARMRDNWRPENRDKFLTKTGGVYLCDYNQDGRLDALVEDVSTGALLYRGLGDGRFVDATDEAGLPRLAAGDSALWTVSCWADLDGDGDEDLISQDRLFENRGDGTFRDVTPQSNLRLAPCAGYAVADYDLDGKVDLYVCHSDKYLVGQKTREKVAWIDGGLGIDNVLWRNLGGWQFEDVTKKTNAGGGGMSCFAAVWFDANDDRRPDVLAINEFGRNAMLLNQPDGTFTMIDVDPVYGGLSMGVTAGDFDNDGRTDVYVANMYSKAGNRILSNVERSHYPSQLYDKVLDATKGSKLYRNLGGGRFEIVSTNPALAEVGWAYGPNFVDLNGDGLLDLYVTAGFKSVQRGKPDG